MIRAFFTGILTIGVIDLIIRAINSYKLQERVRELERENERLRRGKQ